LKWRGVTLIVVVLALGVSASALGIRRLRRNEAVEVCNGGVAQLDRDLKSAKTLPFSSHEVRFRQFGQLSARAAGVADTCELVQLNEQRARAEALGLEARAEQANSPAWACDKALSLARDAVARAREGRSNAGGAADSVNDARRVCESMHKLGPREAEFMKALAELDATAASLKAAQLKNLPRNQAGYASAAAADSADPSLMGVREFQAKGTSLTGKEVWVFGEVLDIGRASDVPFTGARWINLVEPGTDGPVVICTSDSSSSIPPLKSRVKVRGTARNDAVLNPCTWVP
jgi:hypothetical protein